MRLRTLFSAGLVGLCLTIGSGISPCGANNLRVMRGETASVLRVPINRAVVVESDTIFAELSVANPGIADIATLSDRTIYVLGKAPGRTTMTLLGPDGRLITNVEIQVSPDIGEFKERLRQIMPDENIEVRTANDGIVLSGIVSNIIALERALELAQRYAPNGVSNLMSVGGTQQVMLKVRFAEMERSVAKTLSASLGVRSGDVLAGSIGSASTTGLAALGNAQDLGGTIANSRTGAFNLGLGNSAVQVGILIEALEAKGVARTLAEPNLTALSGKAASFLAGGEFPIPVSDGKGGVTIDYKPIGVDMTFTPLVLDDNVINLQLTAAVRAVASSSTTNDGLPIYTFSSRETSTTVEMRDGQSFAIAGLLQDDFRNAQSAVPWLGDVPVLGALFRSSNYSRSQSELVIIVTPHLVTPNTGEALALPTDRIKPPSEEDFFLNGRMIENAPTQGAAGEVARQDFASPYGYVLE